MVPQSSATTLSIATGKLENKRYHSLPNFPLTCRLSSQAECVNINAGGNDKDDFILYKLKLNSFYAFRSIWSLWCVSDLQRMFNNGYKICLQAVLMFMCMGICVKQNAS